MSEHEELRRTEKNDAVIELYRKLDAKDAELAASQARCRELEREIKSLTTCGCEGCDDNLEESAFCLPCMNKVQQQVTQLQATLAAREAELMKVRSEKDEQWIKLSAAVQEAGRLRLAWTTARPTVAGWYWWKHGGSDKVRYVHSVTQATPPILRVECPDGWFEDIAAVDGEWAGPIPLPMKPQQARGSSGGAANQGAGT